MQAITLKARAKINLGLDVLGKRADGYHELRTVMQTLTLSDTLIIKKTDARGLRLVTNLKWLPVDRHNLIWRAADYLLNRYDIPGGVSIELTKNIPVSAGLGGGSSDCAATLKGMRILFKLPVSNDELLSIAAGFGADVPYCLLGGTALAEGIGERLRRLPPHPMALVLVAKPPVSISTADIFGRLSLHPASVHPDMDAIVRGIQSGSLEAVAAALGNTLEEVTTGLCPTVGTIKRLMLAHGAIAAQMSGSGPAVFGYYTDRQAMRQAAYAIKRALPRVTEIHQTGIHNPPVKD